MHPGSGWGAEGPTIHVATALLAESALVVGSLEWAGAGFHKPFLSRGLLVFI